MNLPSDLLSERTLIGNICAPGAERFASMIAPGLDADDFLDPKNKVILEALKNLLRMRLEPSIAAIHSELVKQGRDGLVGGFGGLAEHLSVDDVVRPGELAAIVKSKRRLRDLMKLGESLMRESSSPCAEPFELITSFQESVKKISAGGLRQTSTTGTNILDRMACFEALRSHKDACGGKWGDVELDSMCPIPAGEFAVFGGRPGMGKSTMMSQGLYASAAHGFKPLGLTMEMSKDKLEARIAAHVLGVPFSELAKGRYDTESVTEIGKHADILRNIRYMDPQSQTPWSQLEAMIRYEVDVHGVTTVFLDQFDKIGRGQVGQGSSEAYAFGRVSEGIMGMVKDLGIGFVLLVQLKNESEAEPTLGSHADSDRPGKDAGVVVHLFKSGENMKAKIQKNRDGGWVGKIMDAKVDGACQRITCTNAKTETTTAKPKKDMFR